MKLKDYITIDWQGRISIKDNNAFLRDWAGLVFGKPSTRRGIYLIGNFYVGRSIDLKKRILQHFRSALNDSHPNSQLGAEIAALLRANRPCKVLILSDQNSQELEGEYYHEFLKLGLPLLNIDDPSNPKVPSYTKSKN